MGDIAFGALANRFGRVNVIVAGFSLGGLFGLCTAAAPTWQALAAARFLSAVFLGGCDLVSYVLLTELCSDATQRSRAGCCMQSAFAVGIAVVGIVGGIFAIDWRYMYFVT